MPDLGPQAQRAGATARSTLRRSLGSPALFAIVYSALAGSIYFSLGVVAGRAEGLTPFVFLAAAGFFLLCCMTYVEGASLHQERAGSTVFARYAFNELLSFVAGWALLLDYLILIALCAFASTDYLAVFWHPASHGLPEFVVGALIVVLVAGLNIRGLRAGRLRRVAALTVIDLAFQMMIIVIGLTLVFEPDTLTDPVRLGGSPSWGEAVFALTVVAAGFAGLESASGLSGEVGVSRRGLRRLVASASGATLVVSVGIAIVALSALPVRGGETRLATDFMEAPVVGVVTSLGAGSVGTDLLRYCVGALAAVVLFAAANGAMLGLSRLAYSLATNRQIPSAVGRLHSTRATPFVTIAVAAVLAIALLIPADLEFLVGIYAFGAMLAFTIAHVAVCVLRYREPDRDRPYRMPASVRIGGGDLPLPAVLGALVAGAGWLSVIVLHEEARIAGPAWMALGLALYLIYRGTENKPVLKRVTIPEAALRAEAPGVQYGSILVPLLGTPLDDDIVQTAGRLASEEGEGEDEAGAVIEALWVFEVPMSLPLDAALPEDRLRGARRALARAKAVGEEYGGVEVATATVRARRTGQAIVDEARRRGVEAIVLAAEEPSRIRGGALLGGRTGPLENFVGEVTRYVVEKAPCRVILTAPRAEGPPESRPSTGDLRVTRPAGSGSGSTA